jgi:hypothetical protein
MDQDKPEIIETLNLILARMATKDDVEVLRVEMREGFANIQAELNLTESHCKTWRPQIDT